MHTRHAPSACRVGKSVQNSVVGWVTSLRTWARFVKRDVLALWIAARDPRTPWYAKAAAMAVAAYALSPIDLIPDFVPVVGYVDDALIVPVGILLAVKLIPADLMAEFRAEAARLDARPKSRSGAVFIVLLWLSAMALAIWWFLKR